MSEVPDDLPAESADLVRPYVITNGRGLPQSDRFELITLVTATEGGTGNGPLDPEKRSVMELCEGGYLSVAEIAGHLDLPVGIIKVLLSDLAEEGRIMMRAPIPRAHLTDVQVLQEVLNGLQARFG
ncbi:DUF742 domain-containing protein [Streptomyces carpaticus]|uniref:DUF742 domain-containing protein n=1 Tax=Streptomyces carpaticus TaxID=285558 RepID=A0ABV4ZTE1_9ACTN